MTKGIQSEDVVKCLAVTRFLGARVAVERDEKINSIQELWCGAKRKHLRMRADERFQNEISNQKQWADVIGNCLVEVDTNGIVKTRRGRHRFESVTLYTLIGDYLKPAIIRGIVVNGVIRPKTLFWALESQWPTRLARKLKLTSSDFRPSGLTLRMISKKMRGWFN